MKAAESFVNIRSATKIRILFFYSPIVRYSREERKPPIRKAVL
jgi:hypothetical protein